MGRSVTNVVGDYIYILNQSEAKQWIGFQVNCFRNILVGVDLWLISQHDWWMIGYSIIYTKNYESFYLLFGFGWDFICTTKLENKCDCMFQVTAVPI